MVQNGVVQSEAQVFPIPLTTDGSLFVDVVSAIGRNLGIALTNPSASANLVTITLKDSSGSIPFSPVSLSLQPFQQLARFVTELFGSTVIGPSFSGSVRIQGTEPLSILGFPFTGSQFTTSPVASASGAAVTPARTLATGSIGGPNAVVIPQFAMGGGWATQFAVVNPGGTPCSGRIDIFDGLGNPIAIKLNGLTQSTFTYSIGAGGSVLFAPRDANGQSPF